MMKIGKTAAATSTKLVIPWKIIFSLVGVAIGYYIAVLPAPAGLTVKAMIGMGVFVCTVIWWIVNWLPDYVIGLLMCAAWAGFGAAPFATAFAGFSNATLWLLIGAFIMAAAVSKSGLLTRVSLRLMSLFPLSFNGQTAALVLTGTAIMPLMPSGSAKIAIIAPFSTAISDSLGYERKSEGAAGIFASMYLSLGCIHPLFLSGSFLCYAVVGLLPKEYQADMTWMSWFINALPWGLTVLILGWFAILILYKPEHQKELSPQWIQDQLAHLGPISKTEKFVAVMLAITLILWMTEKMHGINSGIVAIVSACSMIGYGILDRNTFKSLVAWDALMFIGTVFCISGVFAALKIDQWVGKVLTPYVTPLMDGNFLVFLTALCIIIYVLRFILSSQLAVMTIFTLLLSPFAVKAGIHPWITAFAVFVAVNVWILMYQNAQYLVAFYGSAGGEMIRHKQSLKLCFAYMIVSIIGLIVSVPVWKITGLIK